MQCFKIMRSEIEGRLDPKSYTPKRIGFFHHLSTCSTIQPLGSIIYDDSYGVLPPSDCYSEMHPLIFIRATELKPSLNVAFDDALKIPEEYYSRKKARIKNNDILLAVKGATIASNKSVAFVEAPPSQAIVNGSIYRFQVRQPNHPKYIAYLLDTELAKQQLRYNLVANNAVDYLNKKIIADLLIPLPEPNEQQTIVDMMDAAYTAKAEKEAEAEALLAGIDDYVLSELGITLPQTPRQTTFTISSRDVQGARLDPLYYSQKILQFVQDLPHGTLSDKKLVQYIKSGFAAGKQDQAQDNIDQAIIQIRPTNMSDEGYLVFEKNVYISADNKDIRTDDLLRQGEVLFNNTNSQTWVGKTAFFDLEGDYFASNHVTRIKTHPKELDPRYLTLILNLYQRIQVFFTTCTNWNNQSGVNAELLASLPIPLPPLPIQQRIADEVQHRMARAKALRAEAAQLLTDAKARMESMILGMV